MRSFVHAKTWGRWSALAALLTFACAAGCGDSSPPPGTGPMTCNPVCSAGYACQGAVCVPACNPPCNAGETCRVSNGVSACVSGSSDGGVPDDLGGGFDVPVTPNDNGFPPPDTGVPPTDDGLTPVDRPPGTDVGNPPMTDGGPGGDAGPCGMPGQSCCGGRVCLGNGVCDNNRCMAVTPGADECTTTAQCPAGRVCQGLNSGCMAPRWCLQCLPPGTRALGAACMNSSDCANGFCVSGTCSAACVFGGDGDARCRTLDPQMICIQLTNSNRLFSTDASTISSVSTFGGCLRSCRRGGDCAAGTVCQLTSNSAVDRFDQICVVPYGTLTTGMACDPNPPAPPAGMAYPPGVLCQSGQCIATGMHTGYCTSFCVSDADCTGAAPVCDDFFWTRPVSRSNQMIRACRPRS